MDLYEEIGDDNPFRPPQVTHVVSDDSGVGRGFKYPVVLMAIAVVLSTAVACYDIESIVFSGPVTVGIGIWLLIASAVHRHGNVWGRLAGISGLGIALAIYFVIRIFRLSPRSAQLPIGAMIVLYSCGVLIVLGMAMRRARQN